VTDNEKSLARLLYETKRSLQGKAYQVAKKRGGYGYTESDYQREASSLSRTKKTGKGRRHRRRKERADDRESLAAEIEGARGVGPVESTGVPSGAGAGIASGGAASAAGISGLAGRIAGKRETQSGR